MKPAKGGVSPKQSCSCTSCLYRTESDRPSLRKIIAHGSKIDKLYYGKYIPLRERKLLDKLVRTRAVYDGIRTQLLSGSSISIGNADLKPRKHAPVKRPHKDKKKEDKTAQKGGDISALVDLVDKGNVLLPDNSSDCCSCCDCGSSINIKDEMSQAHMHKHRRRGGGHMTSKSSVISRDRAKEEAKLGKAVHFKTKHIRSDPCTCTYKLREMVKRHSKSVMKKLRKDKPEPVLEPLAGSPEQTKPKKRKAIKKSIEKVKQSKTRLVKGLQEGTRKSVTKIKETKTKVKENIEAAAKRSLEKMQETKQKIQEKIESSRHKPEPITQIEEPTEEKVFKIKKDSLTKFREKLRKKRDMKDWECGLECLPGDCLPEECFKVVKRKKLKKVKDTTEGRESTSSEGREKRIGDKPKVSDISIQADKTKKSKPGKQRVGKTETAKTNKVEHSCVCVEIKKKDVKPTKQKEAAPSKVPVETKLKSSLTRKPSKSAPRPVQAESSKEDTKVPKQSASGAKFVNVKGSNQIEKKGTEAQEPQKGRQAVRISSSFSFNIEFYKDRPIIGTSEMKSRHEIRSIIKERQRQSKLTKEQHTFPTKVRKKDKGSETTLNQSIKNIQATGQPLKRCFCTLKLKPRKTKTLNVEEAKAKKCLCPNTPPVFPKHETESVTESIQTTKTSEEPYVLKPHERKPICIPGECDPMECMERIRKKHKKRRSVSIYTKKQMKSSSSITTKSASSSTSRGFQVQPDQKPTNLPQREPTVAMSISPAMERSPSHRQAVRIGSTFSFQIEFSKSSGSRISTAPMDLKTDQKVVEKPKTERGVPKAKRYIRHKYSQISSSTKTKFTTQKHKLRRCFCTLKLNKTEKKKKVISPSKGTITSGLSESNVPGSKPAVKTVAIATKKIRKHKVIVEPELLPYECEPGVCTPGECDPYACLELIKRREIKDYRNKANTTDTEHRKTKSTRSFAPKAVIRSRTKKVQSTFVAYKTKAPKSIPSGPKPAPRPTSVSPRSSNKQAVRIGSSFSFNIEFYKDKPGMDVPVKVHEPPKILVKQERKPAPVKEHGSQIANVTQHKSVLMQAVTKRKNVPIGPAMKRCFCTLKLRKPATVPKKEVNTIGTKTPKFKDKEQKFLNLEPYECEPYVCTPGECDPYECLERIKKRNLRSKSKEIGVVTKASKTKSTSSSSQIGRLVIKDAYAQSKRVEPKIISKNVQHDKQLVKRDEVPKIQKVDTGKQPRQAVRLGSNFSFDIEFHKDRKSDENQIVQVPRERGDVRDSKLLKNQGAQPFTGTMRQHESQVRVIKKVHRGIGVAPMLKRCFCTLQLQKKGNHPIKAPQVYTVSRMGVTQPPFINKQLASAKNDSLITTFFPETTNTIVAMEDSEISCHVLSCSTVQFNSQIAISSHRFHNKYDHSITSPVCLQPLFRRNSNYIQNDNSYVKLPRAARSLCTKNPTPTRHFKKYSEISLMKYYESYPSKIRQHPNEISAYLRRQFCAMNIQVNKYGYKLKPYECEPGVCVPGECDPLVCQERIMKRLMRHASKSSGTRNRIQSESSTTSDARFRSKGLQSQASVAPPRKSQSPSAFVQKTSFPSTAKQAVRVGSNFSFNIEFSKDKFQPPNVVKEPVYYPPTTKRHKTPEKKLRHRGTRDYGRSGIDRESQSAAKMAHRGSSARPLLKRCFCTLKLHKKGGQEKPIISTDDKQVTANNEIVTVQTVDSSQNTKPPRYRKMKHRLEPYECEPGICVPGQCDPYKCLELIKKRQLRGRDFGTDMKVGKMSTASMTASQKRKMKNRCNQLKCKEKARHVQKYEPSVRSLEYKPSAQPSPSRQAVRIGSSFSFNVEFFKEHPSLQARPSVISQEPRYKPEKEIRRPRRTRDFKERFTQDNRNMRHMDSQSDSMQSKKSTMTGSLMKRCFCTAKLHRKEKTESNSQDKAMNVNVEQQSPGSPSLLQRCLCVMKSLTAAKYKSGTPSQTEQESALKPSHSPPSHRLEPYECEPGVCVPGECDPYVCEQLIKKRNAKVCTKETCTAKKRTRSQSSRMQSYRAPRTKQTQMTVDTSSKVVKPTYSGEFETRTPVERSGSPGRQAVKIGSNFSFNIEFYKDRPSTEFIQEKPQPEYHRRRRRSSDDSQKRRPKKKNRGFQREKHRHSRDSQVEGIKTQDRASGVGRLLQRCFCTLNLRKPKVQKQSSDSGTQSKRPAVVKEPPNVDTKSIMTANKLAQHKLEPYECEPNTCIPGQCDPYECEKRIKKRLRREHGTSTVQHQTKSATSMASSAPKLRHTRVQSRSKKTRRSRTGTERARKPTYPKIDLPQSPSRQAVRIGSSFSFNIEFFKENGNEPNVRAERPMPEPKIVYKDDGDSHQEHRRRSSVPCNTKTCQARTRMREVDSQVLAKKMRSTMSGVTPFLKRCFCTLKLQKPALRAQYENENVQTQPQVEPIMTDTKSTYTTKKLKKSRPRPAVRTQHLDPYECEPGVCIPGECDPYECEKRIRMRDIRRHSVSSNTDRSHDASKYVSATAGHRSRKSHATSSPYARHKQKVTMSDIPRPVVRQSVVQPTSSPHRQAVRIGSNFSFDIEFYKDKSGSGPSKEKYPQTISYKSERPKTVRQPRKSKTRNSGAGNRGISFYHRKSQAYGPQTDTKGSGVKPFLKRCFCTLKLHKQGKPQEQPSVGLQADYTPPPSSFDASTRTKKQRHVLEPYECEPGVCVPGSCDPHECLRRIKRRQLKESGVATVGPSLKSNYSLTSRKTTKDQCLKTKCFKDTRPQKMVSFDKEPYIKPKRPTVTNDSPNRQAVRIGSSFKFDIEFYKEGSVPNDQGDGDRQSYEAPRPPPPREHKQRPRHLKTRGSQGKCTPHCQGVQMDSVQRQSRGSGITPLLKRCFCTLALQNTPKQPVAQMQTTPVEEAKTRDICTQSKCKFNKSKSLPYTLDPNECEPNVCVPGECDPYECYERIKRRNARYKSRGFSADYNPYSQASTMTTDNGKYSKRTQSAVLGKHRQNHRSSSANQSMVVEQPRMQLLSDIANRNVVRIGSNFSFNIEFYKEHAPVAGNLNYSSQRRESRPSVDTKQKNTYKTSRYRSRDSQAQTPKSHNKGSLVSNALKRCFCTAQLHKPNVNPPSREANKKCDECNPRPMFGPQQYQVYYHKASVKKKPTKRCVCTSCEDICLNSKGTSTKSKRGSKLSRRFTTKSKKIQSANEMETILPYAPNKFNKKASKTLIVKSNNKANVGPEAEYCKKMKCPKMKKDTISKNRKLKKAKSTKKLRVSKSKKTEVEGKDAITSTASNSNIKSFLCRCKELFSNKKITNKDGTKKCVDICPLCKSDKAQNDPVLNQAEKLKKTKSERRPSKPFEKEPKKSKSLKIKNANDKEEAGQDYSQFQSGDTNKKKVKPGTTKKRKSKILSEDYKFNHLNCGDDYLYLYVSDLNQKLVKDNKKQVKFSDPNNEGLVAAANLTSPGKDKRESKKQKVKKGPAKLQPMKADCQADSGSYLNIVLQPSYCSGSQLEGIAAVNFKGEGKLKAKSDTKRRSTIKDDDTPCPPGICIKKGADVGEDGKPRQPGASISIAGKGSKKYDIDQVIETFTKNINTLKNVKSRVLNTFITKEQICACYSSVCECAKAIRKEKQRAQKIEMQLQREKIIMQENEKRRKEQEKEEKKNYKDFLARVKRYEREDAMRRSRRRNEHKLLSRRLKDVKTSDFVLAAESVLDIAKLGCTVVGNVARSTSRFIRDPKYSCRKMKDAAKNPITMVTDVVEDTGLFSTIRRVFTRLTAMHGVKAIKDKLEENEFTGYLMKMADDDPKKRMQIKKKKKGKNEPPLDDFECSLYMASLRKKRFISVYYLCPWFYPHFITILNVIEQVTDLLLFVVAVFVWSPCILCMELCRAFVCCFLCTG